MIARFLCALLLLTGGSVAMAADNLLKNPGFEDGAANWNPPDGFTLDTTVAHTGKASLRFGWDNADKRKLCLQTIECRPGKRYLITAWLKSDNVHGAAQGATFGVEWYGKKGYIGGSYPMGIGWTTDWTEIRLLSSVVPPDATHAHIFVTLDWGGVGTAWIDDVSATVIDVPDLLKWHLDPESVVGAADSGPFRVLLDAATVDFLGEDVDLAVSLASPPWNHALSEQKAPAKAGATFSFPTDKLYEGVYKMSVILKSHRTGRELVAAEVRTVYKRPPVQALLVPHSGILLSGQAYPSLDLRPYRSGVLSAAIFTATGRLVTDLHPVHVQAGADGRLSISGRPPAPGRYEFRIHLTAEGSPPYEDKLPFTVLSPAEAQRAVVIGPGNVLFDHGKPWFPLFLYAHTAYDLVKGELPRRDPAATADLLDHVAGTPFGLMDYATPIGGLDDTVAFADECARRNVRLMLSVKDLVPGPGGYDLRAKSFPGMTAEAIVRQLARRFRDHPAMAFYYTNDELGTEFFGPMKAMRQWLHEEDPLHPTLHVHYDLECIRELAPCYDMCGPELYPWPDDNLQRMVEWSDTIQSRMPATAPFWGCLWHFRNSPHANEKLRALAFLSIARGAKGLIFYAYHELKQDHDFPGRWKALVALGEEIQQRSPLFLQPEAPKKCSTATQNVVLRTVSGPLGDWLLAVNLLGDGRQASIDLPLGVDRVLENDERIPLSGRSVKLFLAPYDVRILRLEGTSGPR